jgi:phosphohistidine phosphatase
MKLYLSQHGAAKVADKDPARPLSDQGREDVTRTAGFLSLFEKPHPARILHSGKLRAEQTAEMFAEAWGCMDVAAVDNLAPNDDSAVWADRLAATRDDLMLIGHLPHLQRLAGLLICADPVREPVRFRNGGVLCLARSDAGWSVLWQINPTLFYGE